MAEKCCLIIAGMLYALAAFHFGKACGINKAWNDAEKIINAYKKIVDDAIELVKKYAKGGGVDEEE